MARMAGDDGVTNPIRILALEHFSQQDLAALRGASGERFAWRIVPYWRFRNKANEMFPADVLSGAEPYTRPELAPVRARYLAWLRDEVARLYWEWPFDVFMLPSDVFYYVRGLREICHELGIPVLVAQKETTITDRSMIEHAAEISAFAPFVSDRMTVCSERHKDFWVRGSTDPSLIDVTGQPRFDFYAHPPSDISWSEVGLEDGPYTILFLSYEPDAYLLDSPQDWRALRDETEEAVATAAADLDARVVVKLHPLQDAARERELLSRLPGFGTTIRLVPSDTDTRTLILLANVVVGFQTTALFEAMAINKPSAYAGWGELHDELARNLIPFAAHPDLLQVPHNGTELTDWLRARPEPPSAEVLARRLELVEEFLGSFDGNASKRTLDVARSLVEEWAPAREASQRRAMLERKRRLRAPIAKAADLARLAVWRLVETAAPPPARARVRHRAEGARARIGQRLNALRSAG